MNLTIRDYIKRRVRWCFAIGAAGWLLIALGGGLASKLPAGFPDFVLPLAGMLLFFAAIFAMQRLAKCPQCKANLGRTIAVPQQQPTSAQNPIR
jgi:TRAP-type C4-dicarboxylate transport system permease small subunit